jgi:hypothetical protein
VYEGADALGCFDNMETLEELKLPDLKIPLTAKKTFKKKFSPIKSRKLEMETLSECGKRLKKVK